MCSAEYFPGGKGGGCVGLKTLLPIGIDSLEIWKLQAPGNLRACPTSVLYVIIIII
jgi:hypothetical protein